jgi:hypothetical protein
MSFQTSQTVPLVSFVAVTLAQPVSGKINSIASAYRILRPLECISHCSRLNFSDCVGSDLKIRPTDDNHNQATDKGISAKGSEQ